MTLAAVKKLAIKLPPAQRMKLADALYGSIPILPPSVGLAELERRADEVLSGKVKGIPADVFLAELDAIVQPAPKRRSHRGRRPGPANSRTKGTPSGRTK